MQLNGFCSCPRIKSLHAHIPLDFAARASIAVGVDGLLLDCRSAWPKAPGLWWCEHRDRRGADVENEAMATRQTSKQAKSKAEAKVETSATNKPVGKTEREAQQRDPRARSQSLAVQTDRAGAPAAAAPEISSDHGAVVHDKTKQARSRSKPIAARADWHAATASSAEPRASTKRAKLIGVLERPEGASVAEVGQLLCWLPHTVRAAITGLRKAGREVTRSKDADDRSVYRLVPVEMAGER
jgi:Protein of unknown function (DUF3489)